MKFRVVLTALLVACVGVLVAGCGGGSDDGGPSSDQAQQEIQEQKDVAAEQKAKAEQKSENSASEAQEQAEVAAAQNAPGAKTDCGNGVKAGPNTSCAFAENVANKFESTGQTMLKVYSPTAGETYNMSCGPWKDVGSVCRGGENASVYITAG